MTDTTAKFREMTRDAKTGKFVLSIELQDPMAAMRVWDELHGDDKVSVRFAKHRRKRSLDSNAYAWVLMDRLSAKLLIPKEQIYRHYITEIGGVSDTVCVRTDSVNKLRETWAKNGLGWLSTSFPSSAPGYTNVILYYGSSTYDTRQMHRLIELIVQDCKAQGVETADPEEIKALLESWDKKARKE